MYLFLPEDLHDCVRFAYDSGWRKGAITQLERRDVHDGVIRLRPQSAKKKDGRLLALVGVIGEIITCRRAVSVQSPPGILSDTAWESLAGGALC